MTVHPLSIDKTWSNFQYSSYKFYKQTTRFFLFITLTELRQLIICKGLVAIYYGGVLKGTFKQT